MERNKGVKRRFKSQAKQIFRSCLYELTKRPSVTEGRKYEREKGGRIDGKKCKCARKDVKKKTKMETRWKSEWNRNVQKFNSSNYIRTRIKVCKLKR